MKFRKRAIWSLLSYPVTYCLEPRVHCSYTFSRWSRKLQPHRTADLDM